MDKAGQVNIDLLVYLNEIMGLTTGTTILGDPICIYVKEEVMGSIELVEKCFLDYSSYIYDRTTNFSALPAPAYIPEGAELAGWFEFLFETAPGVYTVTLTPPPGVDLDIVLFSPIVSPTLEDLEVMADMVAIADMVDLAVDIDQEDYDYLKRGVEMNLKASEASLSG